MKKEKHKWVKRKDYMKFFGDSEHHYIFEYFECSICGARKGNDWKSER